jgi:hypothetical protein
VEARQRGARGIPFDTRSGALRRMHHHRSRVHCLPERELLPGPNAIKLLHASFTNVRNKLECFLTGKSFWSRLIFWGRPEHT